MTWETPDGKRKLTGSEARLVRLAVASLVDLLEDSIAESQLRLANQNFEAKFSGYASHPSYGIEVVDALDCAGQVATLEKVARYLLTDTCETLELTAVHEGCVGHIFEHLKALVHQEIVSLAGGQTAWEMRTAIQEVITEVWGEHEFAAAALWEQADWNEVLEGLADRILWDRDYLMFSTLADVEPAQSNSLKRTLGIAGDFFTSVADDPTCEHVQHLIHATRRLAMKTASEE